MPCRPAIAALASAVLILAGPPLHAQEEPAPQPPDAIQYFFGPEATEDQKEDRKEDAEPAAQEEKPEADKKPEVREEKPGAEEKPRPKEQPEAKEEPKAKEEQPREASRRETAPVEEAPAPAGGTDAIQYFFGESEPATEARPAEPAKDQKEGRGAGDGKKADAFEHFFGEKEPPAEEKPPH